MKRLVLAICVAALVFGCFEKSNPTGSSGSGNPPAGTIKISTGTYSISGSTMKTITTSSRCDTTTLVTTTDTSLQTFTVTATTLTVTDSSSTQTFTRVGTGTGVEGTWSLTNSILGYTAYAVMTANTVEIWVPTTTIMAFFKMDFVLAFATSGIAIDTSNASAIKLTGKTTKEVVTITVNSQGQLVWSSSVAAHTTFTATFLNPINPTNCNTPETPDWLQTFLMENITAAKNLAKTVDMKTLIAAIMRKAIHAF